MVLEQPPTGANSDRYEVRRKLGTGGSGSVYLVHDRETGEQLALKRLHRTDDRSIARLKREFRALANINHRNVIRLYDLGRARDGWFLTMEYIDGDDLWDHLGRSTSISETLERGAARPSIDPADLERILSAFHQLASGVHALHRAQVLHRDLKPSNVLVAQGRVVVVDFGLALEVGAQVDRVTMEGAIAGTPAYMAPEQVRGHELGESSDWYSFGVMLYEVLSKQLPIDGHLQELLLRKVEADPLSIDGLVSGLPRTLGRLCTGLLNRVPERRPPGAEVLAVLQTCLSAAVHPEPVTAERRSQGRRISESPLVGRELERDQLRRALVDVEAGGFAAVHICGVSGAGKSALVERFLDELEPAGVQATSRHPLILRGRCYEREAIPFKMLDAAMDALVTHLSREDDVVVGHALPAAVQALTQLFPALGRLSVVQRLSSPNPRRVAAPHAREEAESALRELFVRLGSRRPIVLWIDDLHWGDLDSARIIKSWMEPPGIPGMLLLLSYRSDEISTSPCLRLLSESTSRGEPERTIALGPLADEHIQALCLPRFEGALRPAHVHDAIVNHIVLEAGGSPYLASQLATLALNEPYGHEPQARDRPTIEALVSRRTAQLSTPARRLLHVLSAASKPLPAKLALRLAGVVETGRAAVHELSGLELIRTREGEEGRLLAVYHDRLREGVLAGLSASERAELDRELLHALQAERTADAAWLHSLAVGAGDGPAALRYGLIAAAHATAALAFEHAAEIYRACLKFCPDPSTDSLDLWQKLALALAHSGHGRQAAAAYLEAARRAQGERALQLERCAASHLLRSGSFEEGERLVHKVLAAFGLETAKSDAGLIVAIAWERSRLALRGMRFTPRRLEDVPFRLRYGGELCGTLSIEIQSYDPLRAALFQARSLRMALDAGVPEFVARALCVAATMAAVTGGRDGTARADALLARASELEQGLPSPLVHGNICSARAVCAMLQGRMRDVVAHATEAERTFRDAAASYDEGEYYHRFTVLAARVTALFQLGEHERAQVELIHTVNEARATDNVGALLLLSAQRTRMEIASDHAEKAIARLEAERDQLPTQRFGLLHAYYMASVMRVGCATGDHDWALRCLGEDWDRFRRSVFARRGYFAAVLCAVHARLLLNRSVAIGQSAAQAAELIAGDLRVLQRIEPASAQGVIARTRARLAILANDHEAARAHLEASLRSFEASELVDEVARERFALGALRRDAEGAAMQAASLEKLRSVGYVNPLRDLAGYYPELFSRSE